ncbi:hypothetical protein BGX27_002035 [Mortierella sp. AM989]|nr:hypothetical protein BGX27_002035 [Mortierella sp. AM989]
MDSSRDLKANKNVDAHGSWHIAAIHIARYSGNERAACFERAKITVNRRSAIARIIDDCASCSPNYIDLKSAFKILTP